MEGDEGFVELDDCLIPENLPKKGLSSILSDYEENLALSKAIVSTIKREKLEPEEVIRLRGNARLLKLNCLKLANQRGWTEDRAYILGSLAANDMSLYRSTGDEAYLLEAYRASLKAAESFDRLYQSTQDQKHSRLRTQNLLNAHNAAESLKHGRMCEEIDYDELHEAVLEAERTPLLTELLSGERIELK